MNHPVSLWRGTESLPQHEALKSNIKTDVLIIGGGLAGILIAYVLKEKGVSSVVVEKNRIMNGVSGNTTAKVTAQHGLIYHKLIKKYGKDKAQLYLRANLSAVEKLKMLSEKIHCDFEEKDNYVFSSVSQKKLHDEMKALHDLGYGAEYCQELPLPLEIFGAVKFKNQAQFHPLKFAKGIIPDLEIYENTFVREVAGNKVKTDNCTIEASKIVVATHFPFINNHGAYFMKMYQHRSYVLALENAVEYDGMYVDDEKKGMSFRNYDNLLLLGGGDHRTGKNGGNWEELRQFQKANYPKATEKFFWAAQDCITLDGMPYVGLYSPATPNLYVATGFNKWGMTGAMIAAMILADMVQRKENPFSELFSPSRRILRPQLFVNAVESASNLLRLSGPRCPHLGCKLKWNPTEHSWDCPCHGSRFSGSGKLLDGPATGNMKSHRSE